MEPAEAPVIVFKALVIAVEEKYLKTWIGGVGPEAKFENEPRGWFIGLEGSYEYLLVGYSKPSIKIGDIATVRISFERPPSL